MGVESRRNATCCIGGLNLWTLFCSCTITVCPAALLGIVRDKSCQIWKSEFRSPSPDLIFSKIFSHFPNPYTMWKRCQELLFLKKWHFFYIMVFWRIGLEHFKPSALSEFCGSLGFITLAPENKIYISDKATMLPRLLWYQPRGSRWLVFILPGSNTSP